MTSATTDERGKEDAREGSAWQGSGEIGKTEQVVRILQDGQPFQVIGELQGATSFWEIYNLQHTGTLILASCKTSRGSRY